MPREIPIQYDPCYKGEVWERETIGSVQEGVCIDGPFGQKDLGQKDQAMRPLSTSVSFFGAIE